MEVRSDRATGKKRAFKIQDGARLDSMFEEVDRDPFDFSSGGVSQYRATGSQSREIILRVASTHERHEKGTHVRLVETPIGGRTLTTVR